MKASSLKDRVVDVVDELFKHTLLPRDQQPYLLQRHGEVNAAAKLNLKATEKPADVDTLSQLLATNTPLIIDVRSPKEVSAKKAEKLFQAVFMFPLMSIMILKAFMLLQRWSLNQN